MTFEGVPVNREGIWKSHERFRNLREHLEVSRVFQGIRRSQRHFRGSHVRSRESQRTSKKSQTSFRGSQRHSVESHKCFKEFQGRLKGFREDSEGIWESQERFRSPREYREVSKEFQGFPGCFMGVPRVFQEVSSRTAKYQSQ